MSTASSQAVEPVAVDLVQNDQSTVVNQSQEEENISVCMGETYGERS